MAWNYLLGGWAIVHEPSSFNLNRQYCLSLLTSLTSEFLSLHQGRGTRWRSWLKHYATSRKVAGSIPDGVIVMFHWRDPSAAIWPWVESASNRNEYQQYFGEGKGGRCAGLTTLPPSYSDFLGLQRTSTSCNTQVLSGTVQGLLYVHKAFRRRPVRPPTLSSRQWSRTSC